ncbi:MAG: hypothetical protein P1P88_04710 [Bacteroidales bacterium]|nr:hypothetical protein [Bacteroidales bacterium]
MIDVIIEHKKSKLELSHPEQFNELNPLQFRALIRYFIIPEVPLVERLSDSIALLQFFLGQELNKSIKTRWYRVMNSMVEDGILADLLKLQNFIYEEQTFNNWILKEIKAGSRTFYGPRDRFSYMTFGEFISADMMFLNYFEQKTDAMLNRFIATLYKDNLKEEFSTDLIASRASQIEKLDNIDKQGILFNYSSVRYWLTDKYPFVFKGSEQNKQEIHLGNNNQAGWMSIRRNLAGDVLNLDKIDRVLLHDVLADLNEKMSK